MKWKRVFLNLLLADLCERSREVNETPAAALRLAAAPIPRRCLYLMFRLPSSRLSPEAGASWWRKVTWRHRDDRGEEAELLFVLDGWLGARLLSESKRGERDGDGASMAPEKAPRDANIFLSFVCFTPV